VSWLRAPVILFLQPNGKPLKAANQKLQPKIKGNAAIKNAMDNSENPKSGTNNKL
jgi:hypothetical protein